nr:MAG TPA: hypothetical protein [Caudoviricetes sp.]
MHSTPIMRFTKIRFSPVMCQKCRCIRIVRAWRRGCTKTHPIRGVRRG